MNVYMVRYWDHLDYKDKTRFYLANDQEELVSFIDNRVLAPEFRQNNKGKDSLKIDIEEENVSIPYLLPPYD